MKTIQSILKIISMLTIVIFLQNCSKYNFYLIAQNNNTNEKFDYHFDPHTPSSPDELRWAYGNINDILNSHFISYNATFDKKGNRILNVIGNNEQTYMFNNSNQLIGTLENPYGNRLPIIETNLYTYIINGNNCYSFEKGQINFGNNQNILDIDFSRNKLLTDEKIKNINLTHGYNNRKFASSVAVSKPKCDRQGGCEFFIYSIGSTGVKSAVTSIYRYRISELENLSYYQIKKEIYQLDFYSILTPSYLNKDDGISTPEMELSEDGTKLHFAYNLKISVLNNVNNINVNATRIKEIDLQQLLSSNLYLMNNPENYCVVGMEVLGNDLFINFNKSLKKLDGSNISLFKIKNYLSQSATVVPISNCPNSQIEKYKNKIYTVSLNSDGLDVFENNSENLRQVKLFFSENTTNYTLPNSSLISFTNLLERSVKILPYIIN